jgi:alkanesulfonate monooxygenase SsuD/methylene tetrahydromethanopterin reductase-like flavin-dependent oxidoreductase (luciferase family)
MRVCLMIEGQEGVTWPQWLALARACENGGLEGLFRSDHYTSFHGGADGALDAWATISALAAATERIQLGTLVSPVTFRHPSLLARMIVTASQISGGRVELGIGAGWNETEHRQHGFDFPPMKERMERLGEQLAILRLSWGEGPFDFDGRYYHLQGAAPTPKPAATPTSTTCSARPRTCARCADDSTMPAIVPVVRR